MIPQKKIVFSYLYESLYKIHKGNVLMCPEGYHGSGIKYTQECLTMGMIQPCFNAKGLSIFSNGLNVKSDARNTTRQSEPDYVVVNGNGDRIYLDYKIRQAFKNFPGQLVQLPTMRGKFPEHMNYLDQYHRIITKIKDNFKISYESRLSRADFHRVDHLINDYIKLLYSYKNPEVYLNYTKEGFALLLAGEYSEYHMDMLNLNLSQDINEALSYSKVVPHIRDIAVLNELIKKEVDDNEALKEHCEIGQKKADGLNDFIRYRLNEGMQKEIIDKNYGSGSSKKSIEILSDIADG